MCGQMRQFFDATGQLWQNRAPLSGRMGVFTSSPHSTADRSQPCFPRTSRFSTMEWLVVGLPYAFQGQMRVDEITGGSP